MKQETQLLRYGFVVFLDGKATYDHVVRGRMAYADALMSELKSDKHPVLAKRFYAAHEGGVQSPLFGYVSPKSGIESFQSAYYLSDALMRKGMLPVYIAETGEVKDLMPLLADDAIRKDAEAVIQILRARYIKADKRKPTKGFMVRKDESEGVAFDTVELSDAEMLAIFGKLPGASMENVVELAAKANPIDHKVVYIDDDTARRA